MIDRKSAFVLRLGITLALLLPAARLLAQAGKPMHVSYLTATAVYLDAGRADGLTPGARLAILHNGDPVAEVEVDFVAEHSASCRVVSSTGTIQSGDFARLLSTPEGQEAGSSAPPPAPVEVETPKPATPRYQPTYQLPPKTTRASGSLAFTFRNQNDDLGPSTDETTGRISLRLRDIGGKPWELRVRGRSRELSRSGFGPSVEKSQSSDRLYELSLTYVPTDGRVHLYLGRLGAGPFSSLGDLDGGLAEVRLGGAFWFGAFGGTVPDIGDLGFQSNGQKFGAFARYAYQAEDRPLYAEILVGGVTERDDHGDPSRDFVAVESRFGSGAAWWLSQRAEIDFNRDWRKELTGKSSEVSNAALAASFRLSDAWRASLSYDQRRNLLTAETRPRPEEVFTRYLREGGQARFEYQGRGGWAGSFGGGTARGDSGSATTNSAFVSLLHSRVFGVPLLVGLDGSFYSGDAADGWVASLRARYSFRAGHDIGLTLGASESKVGSEFALSPRSNQWARLSGTIQLPARLWLYGEYEVQTGDDFEGNRAFVEVGYRF